MRLIAGSKTLQELNRDGDWELPTSMIDVVFLLLIFFLCATKFRAVERRLEAFLPGGGVTIKPIPDDREITLRVGGTGAAMRTPQFRIAEWSTSDPNELAGHLARFRAIGPVTVAVEGLPDCPFRHIITAVDCCARAGVEPSVGRIPLPSG